MGPESNNRDTQRQSHVKTEIGVMGPQGYFLLEITPFHLGLTPEVLENISPNNSSLVILSGGENNLFFCP